MDSERREARREARRRELARRRRRTLAGLSLLLGPVLSWRWRSRPVAAVTRPSRKSQHDLAKVTHGSTAAGSTTSPPHSTVTGAGDGQARHRTRADPDVSRDQPAARGAPFPGLYVEPSEFAAQMRALASAGYHAITQDQMWAYWKRGVALPPGKPIVVSFDNGYQSQYTNALPVLRGWAGSVTRTSS